MPSDLYELVRGKVIVSSAKSFIFIPQSCLLHVSLVL